MSYARAQESYQATLEHVRAAREEDPLEGECVQHLEEDLLEAERLRDEAFYRMKLLR